MNDMTRPGSRLRSAVRMVTTMAEFRALAGVWDGLQERAAVSSVFVSWVWQYEWWRVYGRGQALRILVAEQAGEAIGILPLYLQAVTVLGVGVKKLRLIGTGGDTYPDDLGPLLAAGHESVAATLLAAEIARSADWDVLELSDIDSQSVFPDTLARMACELGLEHTKVRAERIVYLRLPATWDAFLMSLHGGRRSRMRSARKKLASAHRTRFFVWEDGASLDQCVDRLIELHRKRWESSGASDSFATREYCDFHRAAIKACHGRGWLRMHCLEVSGKVAAILYCYRFRNRVFLMQAGFDPELARFKPGSVLLGYAIEHAIAEGNEVLDFLRGEHRYKNELATGERETASVSAYRPTSGAWIYRTRRIWIPSTLRIARSRAASMMGPIHARINSLTDLAAGAMRAGRK